MKLSNKSARRLAIHCTGLGSAPTGSCKPSIVLALIQDLGYVQIDPLQIVARAHDHILWSRNNQYRPPMLHRLLNHERSVFEHFSHDACILPMQTLIYWQDQFERQAEKLTAKAWRENVLAGRACEDVLERIRQEGPLRSNDFKSAEKQTHKPIWSKPEHKKILDLLWLRGDLAVSKRVNFSKFYDLSERIYPQHLLNRNVSQSECVHWLSTHALTQLGFASPGEIMRFWSACDLDAIKQWSVEQNKNLLTLSVESADGQCNDFLAARSIKALLDKAPEPTKRLRILNPFDPLVRDRKRLERLFEFEYRIEIYTPPKQRQYGYYVYPLLEYDRFVGRIEVRHDRTVNQLRVDNLWAEPTITFGKGRRQKLDSELERLRRFCSAENVVWS